MLRATEMGLYKNLDEAVKSVKFEGTLEPQKQNHAIYKDYSDVFDKLSTKFNAEFEAIANLQQKIATQS